MSGVARRALAAVATLALAVLGRLETAAAQEGARRSLATPDDTGLVIVVTALVVVAVLLLAAVGRLYELQRGLHWRFQDPDEEQEGGAH